jgi:bla regulator protein blaR1
MKTALTVAAALLFLQGCASEPAEEPSSEALAPSCPKPAYPEAALKERKEGTTRLRYYVNENGAVTKSEVIASSGSFLLDMTAQGAIASCRFPPTIRDRVAVSVTAETEYVWRVP